jgi:translocation protein SEC63
MMIRCVSLCWPGTTTRERSTSLCPLVHALLRPLIEFILDVNLVFSFHHQFHRKYSIQASAKKRASSGKKSFLSKFTWKLGLAWAVYAFLIYYVRTHQVVMDRFDPFEILQVSETASDSEIKRAYRKLSLVYHPDKNPDPEANAYFAEKVTKAYKALTDQAAKENFIKYGHPDGRQAMEISVALPEWFFNDEKDAAPAILLSLLLGGIVLPLGWAAWYLRRSRTKVDVKDCDPQTQQLYMFGPFSIKAQSGVVKMMETLVCAGEFLPLELGKADGEAMMNQLRPAVYPYQQEVGDVQKSSFYQKRPTGVVKAHMLLYGHMCRQQIPSILHGDFDFVMKKTPRLIQELFMLSSSVPRIKPGYGWAQPSISAVELMQCMVRAVPIEAKRHFPAPMKSRVGPGTLVQLPHLTHKMVLEDLAKKKITSLTDLLKMEDKAIMSELAALGLEMAQSVDILRVIYNFPALSMAARAYLDDDSEAGSNEDTKYMANQDIVTVSVSAFLNRRVHSAPDFKGETIPQEGDKTVPAIAPNYPFPKDEFWVFMVCNPADGALLCHSRVCLAKAEKQGYEQRVKLGEVSGKNNPEELVQLVTSKGQEIKMQFVAPAAGKHKLTLIAMCDSWIGADYGLGLNIECVEPTRAQKEGRAGKNGKKQNLDRSEESELQLEDDDSDDTGEIVPDSDVEDEEDEEGLWDEDEYGTEESESEGEDEDGSEGKKDK